MIQGLKNPGLSFSGTTQCQHMIRLKTWLTYGSNHMWLAKLVEPVDPATSACGPIDPQLQTGQINGANGRWKNTALKELQQGG